MIENSPLVKIGKSESHITGAERHRVAELAPPDPRGLQFWGRRIPVEFVAIRLITRRLVPHSTRATPESGQGITFDRGNTLSPATLVGT